MHPDFSPRSLDWGLFVARVAKLYPAFMNRLHQDAAAIPHQAFRAARIPAP